MTRWVYLNRDSSLSHHPTTSISFFLTKESSLYLDVSIHSQTYLGEFNKQNKKTGMKGVGTWSKEKPILILQDLCHLTTYLICLFCLYSFIFLMFAFCGIGLWRELCLLLSFPTRAKLLSSGPHVFNILTSYDGWCHYMIYQEWKSRNRSKTGN